MYVFEVINHMSLHPNYALGNILNEAIRTLLWLTVDCLNDSRELYLDSEESGWNINVYMLKLNNISEYWNVTNSNFFC